MLKIDLVKKWPSLSITAKYDFIAPVIGIFGPSGAGKSTLLHMIAGIIPPDTGTIELNDTVLFDGQHNIPIAKRNIGYVRQEPLLFPHLTVQNNLKFAQQHSRSSTAKISFAEAIESFSLQKLLSRYPQNLSGGEKQKVALARALLASPEYLLLDEPMASLDNDSAKDLLIILTQYKSNLPMVYVSHNEKRMNDFADDIIVMEQGHLRSP